MSAPNIPPGFDFTDPDIYAQRLPVAELAELRHVAPIWWNEQPMGKGGFDDGGYWVVTKHKDVKEVSRRNDVYLSAPNTALPQFPDDMTREDIDMQRVIMLNMDGEHHDRLRRIISRGFTPRAVERLREDLAERARQIVATAAAEGSGDFVEQVACELPLQAIAGLLGVPLEDRKKLFDWSNQMVSDDDPEFAHHDNGTASVELIMYAMQLAALRAEIGPEAAITPAALAPLDHFHGRGVQATKELLAVLRPLPTDHVLDIGCGIGGPARWIAARAGCRVTGIDLKQFLRQPFRFKDTVLYGPWPVERVFDYLGLSPRLRGALVACLLVEESLLLVIRVLPSGGSGIAVGCNSFVR